LKSLSDIEILDILTDKDKRESYSLPQIKEAQLLAEKRGLDTYLYINDRETYHRLAKKEIVIDNRVSSKVRFVNLIVDTFILLFIITLITILITSFGSLKMEVNWNNHKRLWIILLSFFYYLIQEGIWNKTIGKMITKTIVVSEKDKKPSFQDIFIRTSCRFIPLEPLSFTFMKDGFHDIFSKTKVIGIKK